MNGDLSRVTFSPLNYFTRVVFQQGRVQMDADGNEQAAILLYYLRSLAADLIGQHGGPDDVFDDQLARTGMRQRNCGFAIIAADKAGAGAKFFPSQDAVNDEEQEQLKGITDKIPLLITRGHYYIDGLLCENEGYWLYPEQPNRMQANDNEISNLKGIRLLYIDVWERLVTALEDSSIREVALGGADTAARTKVTWQVKVAPESDLVKPGVTCDTFNWLEMRKLLEPDNRGRLQAKAKSVDAASAAEACVTSPEARYRGMENQLYRVEVHKGGAALDSTGSNRENAATFKWSRDNGTIVAALKQKQGDRLIVSGLRDFSRWFTAGNWVEITHDALELNGLPGTLVRLARAEGETLTIDPYTTSGTVYDPDDPKYANLKVRRWDQKEPENDSLQDGAMLIEEKVWIDLEDGVQIWFEPGASVTQYRTGDYWSIPARVATGDVEWPSESLPPHGVEHHYAPLAAVTFNPGQVTVIVDLRHKFPPLGVCK